MPIAVAIKSDWDILQFDVKNAFSHCELEEVYVAIPLGYGQSPTSNRFDSNR